MNSNADIESIAIIGMAGRFPGAASVAEFWSNLCAGKESITQFSDSELLAAGVDARDLADPLYVRARGILDGTDCFDADFFGWTPREAELADPQQRLFLQCVWEAFEDAGLDPSKGTRSVGVFAGASLNTYFLSTILRSRAGIEAFVRGFQAEGYAALIGNDKDYLATRVAHQFDFRGPALTIQTACSTSLVAIAQACQSLLTYQCDLAVAGGVSVTFPQARGYLHQEGAIGSRDGHCRAFDALASGTVFGSGCGTVLLRRLSDATAARDPIYAIIRSIALNNDGADKASYLAPSVEGQAEVIALTHALAGISADSISYVEAHGTGTPVGDPIEIAGLTKAFRHTTNRTGFCRLGSLKTNIGHLESAAGVTGIIKTALALRNRVIPGTLHFQTPHPDLDLSNTPFQITNATVDWNGVPRPRRAGVSSFGVGGTNAHAILEETPAPVAPGPAPARPYVLLPLSARDADALQRGANRLANWLATGSPNSVQLQNVAYTLQVGRQRFSERRFVIAQDASEAVAALQTENRATVTPRVRLPLAPSSDVVFMFPGQGVQYANMGHELYQTEPIFQEELDRCLERLAQLTDFDWRSALFPPSPHFDPSALDETKIAQPLLFSISYALARLWIAWGVRPTALIGHSVGEFVAAVIAGSLPVEIALSLVVERARLMQSMEPGAMLAVRATPEELRPWLTENVSAAVINAPRSVVVAGPIPAVERLATALNSAPLTAKRLRTSHAFHSPMMASAATAFAKECLHHASAWVPARLPVASTLTGRMLEPSDWCQPKYWSDQMHQPVQFAAAVGSLAAAGHRRFLETGVGTSLSSAVRQILSDSSPRVSFSLPPDLKTSATRSILQATGELWADDIDIDWDAWYAPQSPRRLSLPTYSFNPTRHWFRSNPQLELETSLSPKIPSDLAPLEVLLLDQLQTMSQQLAILDSTAKPEAPLSSAR